MANKIILTEEEKIMTALVYVGETLKYDDDKFDEVIGIERYNKLKCKAIALMDGMGSRFQQDEEAYRIADKLLKELNL